MEVKDGTNFTDLDAVVVCHSVKDGAFVAVV